jgi:hypothetical protein
MGNGLTYSRYRTLLCVGIFQTYRPSGQIYGIFQKYVRISNFYGFQMSEGEVWAESEGGQLECQVVLSQTESVETMKLNVLGCQN